MITNNLQLKSSKAAVRMLKKTLKAPAKKGIPKEIVTAARGHIKEFLNEIEDEIAIYETQKSN